MNIRRILVALDASAHSRAALEAACELALGLDAELSGLFVEDINLLRLAQLPFASEISYPSALRRELNPDAIEGVLKGIAEQARRAMAEVAGRVRVPWTFRVARGTVASELLAALAEADLLTIGMASREFGRRLRLGSTALAAMTAAPSGVLLLRHGAPIRAPAMVVFDGSEASFKALGTAAQLAKVCGDGLIVLILADELKIARELQKQASAALKGVRQEARFRLLAGAERSDLIQAVRLEGAGLFVLPGSNALLQRDDFQDLVAQIGCPVFVMRSTEAT
ncbi:MAG: universal stress protein [Terrimicrobiaceae bacterium]